MKRNLLIVLESAFEMMKNGVYFIVIALLVAELSKILIILYKLDDLLNSQTEDVVFESKEVQKHFVVMSSCNHVTEEGTENARDIIVQAREKRTQNLY